MASLHRLISTLGLVLSVCVLVWLSVGDNDQPRTVVPPGGGLPDHQQVINVPHDMTTTDRKLQDDNPFSALGEILIQLLEIILLIFGSGGGSTPTPAPVNPGTPTSSFNIRLQYDSSVPESHIFLFEEAKELFERVITQDIEDVPLSELTDTDPIAPGCTYSDVDDIDICIYYTNSVTFGTGGYNNRRFTGPNQPLPATGHVAINTNLEADEFLRDLIVHEMAHALVRRTGRDESSYL